VNCKSTSWADPAGNQSGVFVIQNHTEQQMQNRTCVMIWLLVC
jgi:hypothetical protein